MSADAKRMAAEAQLSALPVPMEEASWAHQVRAEARSRLLEAGAPARRDEYWKYTDPAAFTAPLRLVAAEDDASSANPTAFDLYGKTVHFVNGRMRSDLSSALVADGLAGASLSDVLGQDITIARELFGVLELAGQEKVSRPLATLNTAVATQGVVLQVTGEAGALHLRYDQTGDDAAFYRHVVRVEKGASLTLLESGFAANTVLEVDVARGGSLHHVRLQDNETRASATHVFVRIGEGAHFASFTMTTNGKMTRNEVVMDLCGEGASGHVGGAVLGSEASHCDNTVFVTHSAAHCESRQVFKNVLAGKAKGVFQGKIFVREGAQKTDGYQISQSVLLNDGAEFLAKPELEIYADDVACSHGSTTGALDQTALFYLRSRGVPQADAEAMLVAAFAEEAIAEIQDDALAEIMRATVADWMQRRG